MQCRGDGHGNAVARRKLCTLRFGRTAKVPAKRMLQLLEQNFTEFHSAVVQYKDVAVQKESSVQDPTLMHRSVVCKSDGLLGAGFSEAGVDSKLRSNAGPALSTIEMQCAGSAIDL